MKTIHNQISKVRQSIISRHAGVNFNTLHINLSYIIYNIYHLINDASL